MNKEIEILVEDQLIPIKNNDGRTVVTQETCMSFLKVERIFQAG